jgi:hypothetical protein
MNYRQLGRFRIDLRFIEKSPDLVAKLFAFLGLLPIHAETRLDYNAIEYMGVCNRFSTVPLSAWAPEYEFVVTQDAEGNIAGVDVNCCKGYPASPVKSARTID